MPKMTELFVRVSNHLAVCSAFEDRNGKQIVHKICSECPYNGMKNCEQKATDDWMKIRDILMAIDRTYEKDS